MAYVYVPSCKFTEFSSRASAWLCDYMRDRYDAVVMGCCRPGHAKLGASDIAVTVCNTCYAIIDEDSPAKTLSVFELLAGDAALELPNFHGERMAIQDCWRSRGRHAQQEAVRELMRRMNVDVVELHENRDKSRFCGTTLLAPQPEENRRFAPCRLGAEADAAGFFEPCAEEEQTRLMREHAQAIGPEKIVCYCVPCTKGIRRGGKHGIHLAEMILGLDG